MRWGVRRSRPSGGSSKTTAKKPAAKPPVKKPAGKPQAKKPEPKPVVKAEVANGPKKASEMSNEEIQKVLQRVNLERQYNELVYRPLTESQKTGMDKAKAFATKVAKKAGEKAVQKVADKAAEKVVGNAIDLAFGKTFGKTIVGKKP